MSGGREAGSVAYADEDPCSSPDADPRHGRQDLGKRAGLQQFIDPRGDEFPLVKQCLERIGEAGDQSLGRPRCLRADQVHQPPASGLADPGRRTELLEKLEHGRALHSRARDPLQRWVGGIRQVGLAAQSDGLSHGTTGRRGRTLFSTRCWTR